MNAFLSKIRFGWLIGICALNGLLVQAATVQVQVSSSTSLEALEQKAKDSDRYRVQCYELQRTLDEMLALIGSDDEKEIPSTAVGMGQLSMLLEKAASADILARELDDVRVELEKAITQRDAMKAQLNEVVAEQEMNMDALTDYTEEKAVWLKKRVGMEETISRLLLGEFEYYEVKEGDSLQSIASNPMVYGDSSRAAWLRQVNEDRVKRLDNLRAGEMLIIPRFPRNGTYEF